jgi:hypothetical protein
MQLKQDDKSVFGFFGMIEESKYVFVFSELIDAEK